MFEPDCIFDTERLTWQSHVFVPFIVSTVIGLEGQYLEFPQTFILYSGSVILNSMIFWHLARSS